MLFDVLPFAGLFLVLYFTIWFVASEMVRNASIVDVGWGLGFASLAAIQLARGFTIWGLFLAIPVWIWGLRLAWHIGRRNFGKPEDFRYAAFRRDWGSGYRLRAYFQLFLFQGLLMGVISLPFLFGIHLAAVASSPLAHSIPLLAAGLLLWFAGFLMETVSDSQLKKFTSNAANRGGVVMSGLWRHTRHPNYFGEAVSWWGIWVAALSLSVPWWTVFGPIVITLVIRYVSGVPMLEKRMEGRPGYAEYARSTPIFVPWPCHRK